MRHNFIMWAIARILRVANYKIIKEGPATEYNGSAFTVFQDEKNTYILQIHQVNNVVVVEKKESWVSEIETYLKGK